VDGRTPSSLPRLQAVEHSESVGGEWRFSRQALVGAPTDRLDNLAVATARLHAAEMPSSEGYYKRALAG
jgi:hypothetical protein